MTDQDPIRGRLPRAVDGGGSHSSEDFIQWVKQRHPWLTDLQSEILRRLLKHYSENPVARIFSGPEEVVDFFGIDARELSEALIQLSNSGIAYAGCYYGVWKAGFKRVFLTSFLNKLLAPAAPAPLKTSSTLPSGSDQAVVLESPTTAPLLPSLPSFKSYVREVKFENPKPTLRPRFYLPKEIASQVRDILIVAGSKAKPKDRSKRLVWQGKGYFFSISSRGFVEFYPVSPDFCDDFKCDMSRWGLSQVDQEGVERLLRENWPKAQLEIELNVPRPKARPIISIVTELAGKYHVESRINYSGTGVGIELEGDTQPLAHVIDLLFLGQTPRGITLEHYPRELRVGFNRERWIQLCNEIRARDDTPLDRDETRAWYDTLRDFLPKAKGLDPTIRIFRRDYEWCSLDSKNSNDVARFMGFLRL